MVKKKKKFEANGCVGDKMEKNKEKKIENSLMGKERKSSRHSDE